MKILGIETSCDETAAAVVEDGVSMLSNVIATQIDIHAEYGGVVPEVAARSHLEVILPVVQKALDEAKTSWDEIDAIAVTQGPGLLGSLLIGTLTARTLALLTDKPLVPVNHVVAHTYANFLIDSKPQFPLVSLSVSGGHSHLLLFEDHLKWKLLGQTLDDAAGEAFDKVAKVLGLPYPGGPAIGKAALEGDELAFNFPKANLGKNSLNFSFSGLKTSVLRHAQQTAGLPITTPSSSVAAHLTEAQVNSIAASFQRVIVETLVDKLVLAAELYKPKSVVIAGGVAASQALRSEASKRLRYDMSYAPMNLCTDNAAMIASLGYWHAKAGQYADPRLLQTDPSLAF
jgi:N6-L-threonylcarbamoyladenine synthase